jgi:pimeloyl-ACP methyl ester carboxylesterase
MTVSTSPTIPLSQIGGCAKSYPWTWQARDLTLVYETLGQGSPILLLPALSTVSSRTELGELAAHLSSSFQVFAIDWLGFGQSDRPWLNYQPQLYQQVLCDFVRSTFCDPIPVVAAGHAAGYVMQLAAAQPGLFSQIILVAPTWRGPLPTMGVKLSVASAVRELVRSPILGQMLYKLNTLPGFLRWMYRRHVYVNPDKLTPEFIQSKWQITQQPGARFAPAAFVTGTLDPARSRSEFLSWFDPLPAPILALLSEQAPPKSKAEMAALAEVPGIQVAWLPGTLGMHEEFAPAIAQAIDHFLRVGSNP